MARQLGDTVCKYNDQENKGSADTPVFECCLFLPFELFLLFSSNNRIALGELVLFTQGSIIKRAAVSTIHKGFCSY